MANNQLKLDKNPQWIRGEVTESGANTYTEVKITVNIPRGYALNILHVFLNQEPGTLSTADGSYLHLRDRSSTTWQGMEKPGVLASNQIKSALSTSGGNVADGTKHFPLSDGQGNGVVYAKSTLYLGILGLSQAAALFGGFAMLVTLVKASAQEILDAVANG